MQKSNMFLHDKNLADKNLARQKKLLTAQKKISYQFAVSWEVRVCHIRAKFQLFRILLFCCPALPPMIWHKISVGFRYKLLAL